MFKELQSDIKGFKHPGHGNLIGWANQGSLFLHVAILQKLPILNI